MSFFSSLASFLFGFSVALISAFGNSAASSSSTFSPVDFVTSLAASFSILFFLVAAIVSAAFLSSASSFGVLLDCLSAISSLILALSSLATSLALAFSAIAASFTFSRSIFCSNSNLVLNISSSFICFELIRSSIMTNLACLI